jgi:hypothetical protein
VPRVNQVKRANKSPGSCGKCGDVIPAGYPYKHWSFRYGGKHIRCMKPACAPKAADLTQSEFLRSLAGIQEDLDQARKGYSENSDVESFADELEEIAGRVRELGEECQEKLDNMPEGLQQGQTGELLQERAEACENAASELETAAEEAREKAEDLIDESAVDDLDLIDTSDGDAMTEWGEENDVVHGDDESDGDFLDRLKAAVQEHNSKLLAEVGEIEWPERGEEETHNDFVQNCRDAICEHNNEIISEIGGLADNADLDIG